ncbi:MAG: SURF1 family cytochrome oxidase biogenesis protein [Hellea sp.]
MKLHFKPMPWLTAIVAICLFILISLGTWQYQRLQWKTALLAEVEAAVTAPPFTSLAEFQTALEAGKPVDFRRIGFTATPKAQTPIYAVYGPGKGGIYWDLFRQYSAQPDIFGKYDRARDAEKPDGTAVVPAQLLADQNIGYVRKVHAMGGVESKIKSKPNPAANRWFKFNQSGRWGQGDVMTSYYIDITAYDSTAAQALDAASLPVRRPEIRNNHFDYMLTWYSFAIILLIIYAILHRRAGRLKFS